MDFIRRGTRGQPAAQTCYNQLKYTPPSLFLCSLKTSKLCINSGKELLECVRVMFKNNGVAYTSIDPSVKNLSHFHAQKNSGWWHTISGLPLSLGVKQSLLKTITKK